MDHEQEAQEAKTNARDALRIHRDNASAAYHTLIAAHHTLQMGDVGEWASLMLEAWNIQQAPLADEVDRLWERDDA